MAEYPTTGNSSSVPPRPVASAKCKNCSEQYDPADKSDPIWGAFVGPRYCGWCGAQEARILADAMGVWD